MSPEHESDLVTALHEAVERARVLHGREMAQKLARPSHTEYGYWSARVGRFISLDDPEPFARLGYQVLQREVTDWQPYQQETNPWITVGVVKRFLPRFGRRGAGTAEIITRFGTLYVPTHHLHSGVATGDEFYVEITPIGGKVTA